MPETTPSAVLIMAHPGHELLLHHWLESCRPVVFAMTDGSGGSGVPRSESSKRLIRATGSSIGTVFGPHPDRFWYDCILWRDPAPFHEIAARISDSLNIGVAAIVTDPLEYFNPVHDLAAVTGHLVANRLAQRQQRPTTLTYPIERPAEGIAIQEIALDEAALRRKHDAARGYLEIANEVDRFLGRERRSDLQVERLYPLDAAAAYPEMPASTPYYETFAQQRLREGRYRSVITYRDHMRPLIRALLDVHDR